MGELRRINPFKCRMWSMHDRMGEDAGGGTAYRSLVESLKAQGQKQPVLGRCTQGSCEFEVELIYGARRLAAARELGMELLVEIREIDDRDALIEMDIENRVREDISPYERGMSYRRWLRSGLFATQAEIAKALGVSEAQVCRLLKFGDLPAAIVAAFRSPHEIREEWAGNLWNLCRDPAFRDGMLRRARRISSARQPLSPQEVYETLVTGVSGKAIRARTRDEVVKGGAGQPLFRIGFRAKAVHFIVPREMLSEDMLANVSTQLKQSLDSSPKAGEKCGPEAGQPRFSRPTTSGARNRHHGLAKPLLPSRS